MSSRLRRSSDLVFLGVRDRRALERLARLRDAVAPAGAVWVVWPRGSAAVNENDVRDAALAQGLVDVKVAAFSERLSALKLVIRLRDRRAASGDRA